MVPDPKSRLHKFRVWCFGSILGVMLISTVCNLISESIPNPINYVIRWIKGEKKQAEHDAPQARLEIFLPDGKTPLAHSTVTVETGVDFGEFKNCMNFLVEMRNVGEADTGPLRFFYYLDAKLPKPESAQDTKEVGYGYEMPGGTINIPSGGNLVAGSSAPQKLGVVFGATPAVPARGDYKFLARIRNTVGAQLYEGALTLRVP